MAAIDEYSVSTAPIQMYFDQTPLSLGTAFVWQDGQSYFLITNWHNLSGRNPISNKHLSPTAAEPNMVKVWLNERDKLGSKHSVMLRIQDQDGQPLWLTHPRFGNKVDVVALPLSHDSRTEMYPINKMPTRDLSIQVGMEVFILGYPFGLSLAQLPIWKRGSIASEPEILDDNQPCILIDTASRPGMSGSPIIRRSWGMHFYRNGDSGVGSGSATALLGIYSGRLTTADPLDAQLGLAWPATLIPEIVSAQRRDTR
ncbi:MAG: serine protease [Alphaproteobacteria bacterium]